MSTGDPPGWMRAHHHSSAHPDNGDPFAPQEHPPAHAELAQAKSEREKAEQINELSYLALRKVIDMAQALRDQASAATAEMHRAALINADLTTKNAALSTHVADLETQVATLSANQEDPAAEQAAADELAAATAALKSADDVAQPPPVVEPAPAAEVDPNAPPVEPDPNATV